MATDGNVSAGADATNKPPDSLCALYALLKRELDGLPSSFDEGYDPFVAAPSDEARQWLVTVKAVCDRLKVPTLYGPDDEHLRARVRLPPWAQSMFPGKPPADGLRLGRVLKRLPQFIFDTGEVCPKWEGPLPGTPIRSMRVLKQYLVERSERWFRDIDGNRTPDARHSELQLSWAKIDLRNIQNTLSWMAELRELPIPVADYPMPDSPPQSADQIEHATERLLVWMREWLARLARWADAPTESELTLARNLALESNHKAEGFRLRAIGATTPADGWNADGLRRIDQLTTLKTELDKALTPEVVGWLHRWNCGEDDELVIGGLPFHTAHEAALECVSRVLTAYLNAEKNGEGSEVKIPPTWFPSDRMENDRYVPWEWNHEQLNKQIEREWGRAIRALSKPARVAVSEPVQPLAVPSASPTIVASTKHEAPKPADGVSGLAPTSPKATVLSIKRVAISKVDGYQRKYQVGRTKVDVRPSGVVLLDKFIELVESGETADAPNLKLANLHKYNGVEKPFANDLYRLNQDLKPSGKGLYVNKDGVYDLIPNPRTNTAGKGLQKSQKR